VPASVSTVDGEFIRKSGVANFDALQDYAPNVTISLGATSGVFAIRGFATPDTNPGFDPSVGAVVDGVYYGRSQFMDAFFADLDRFEVLRGPQGSLFGKNSTAGVLNVVTQAPQPEAMAVAEVQQSSFGDTSIRPVIQLPLGSTFSLRYAGNYAHGDKGVLYNTFLQRKEEEIIKDSSRLRARWTPDAYFTLDLEGFYSKSHSNNNGFQFSTITPRMQALVQSYDPADNATVDRYNSASYPSLMASTIEGANMTVSDDVSELTNIDDAKVTLITSHAQARTTARDLDADFTPVNFIHDTLAEPSGYTQTSEELRLSGHGKSMGGFGHGYNFVGGVFMSGSNFHSSDLFAVEDLGAALAYCNATPDFCGLKVPAVIPPGVVGQVGQTLGNTLDQVAALAGQGNQSATVKLNQQGSDFAVFGQFEHFFLPQWALIGGLRYGIEKKTGTAYSHSASPLVKQIANQAELDNVPLHRIEHDLSPKAGIKWEGDETQSAYLTWARGYKSGGFNALPLSGDHLEYEPEQATSIEAGGKALTHFLGGPLRLSVAVFRTDFDNLQVSTFLGGDFIVLNAAAARSQGFDLDLHWLTPLRGLSITAQAGLADAKYKSYPCAPAIADSTAPGNPSCTGKSNDTTTQDLTGKPLSFSPRWTAGFIPAWQFSPLDTLSTTLALDLLYRGSRYLDVDLDPRKVQAATTLINGRVVLETPSKRWGLSLVAHNLTDKVFGDQAISQPLAPGNVLLYHTDRGRYVTGDVTVQF
ncbi:MAG TPA: TonB-dependent receptor, partial [Nevskiaceae bacterium]|nr:TonB-dependent receptor [Nevskiaceae bacterium]